jgi:ATP-dependent DNA helicase RecQ
LSWSRELPIEKLWPFLSIFFNMSSIAFIDAEINLETGKILDLGAILDNGEEFHKNSLQEFLKFVEKADFICGHNILNHDLKYIELGNKFFIDTLFWSPLLFPKKPYHNLLKDDKLLKDELSNPLSDAKKARDLFFSERSAFEKLDKDLRSIFYLLLQNKNEFNGLFRYYDREIKKYDNFENRLIELIKERMEVCKNAPLDEFIKENQIELAYCIALINTNDFYSITPPWILKNFPKIESIFRKLRNTPCKQMCSYCLQKLDVKIGLKHFFDYDNYREYASEPLQEKAANSAIYGKSILVLFPTGGGKSVAFQVPALMSGENERGLTVVISPLQSLMKDQVDNLEKLGITSAAAINGLLDPIKRKNVIERVEDGSVHLLYISPESLRSNTIEKILLKRNIVRFVIDEAHCFSAWGQDFRPDYLYIADFIKKLQEKKNCESIPVSCFTATAKPEVIDNIQGYFNKKLGLDLELIKAKNSRENLRYKIIEKESEDKYAELRNVIKDKDCPTIVYVSKTKTAESLAERLCKDELNAKPFHGKLTQDIKIQNQNEFMQGNVQIIVATSAFGMGVDKKDVGLVVHYDISDSLENYLQEAGRAGRNENIKADCYVLFNETDLDSHFLMLNQTRLSIKEINQIWKAIKSLSKIRSKFQKSPLEIARNAGWDDSEREIETRVINAINALEQANYIKRENNSPRVYADSIMLKTMREVSQKIEASQKFIDEKQKETAKRIMSFLYSSKARQKTKEKSEEKLDYIADNLGLEMKDAIEIVTILRDEKILSDAKDIIVFIDNKKAANNLKEFVDLEKFLISQIEEQEKILNIKELNEQINSIPAKIKTIFNFLAISHLIEKHISGNRINICAKRSKSELEKDLEIRNSISNFTLEFLNNRIENNMANFSIIELRDAFNAENSFFKTKAKTNDIENALLYLSRIGALNIEGGFLVTYNRLNIERLNNKRQYTKDDYEELNRFYENKTMQIHIVGEYAKKMLNDEKAALSFADDYFNLNYSSFLRKYFDKTQQKNIKRNISIKKYKQLFEDLSNTQREIIDNKEADCIVVAAGPGSGKTKTLVHKLASLLIMEDVRPEQLLMLTFSRAAATEFKKRLIGLIGKTAYFVDIKTFHSYCFDLLGKIGSLEYSEEIIKTAVEKIKNGEIEENRITKTCLVIDEAQDMSAAEFEMVEILNKNNENMRIIAVGDDDQNIYEFRCSSSSYFRSLREWENCAEYKLLDNYRSKANIVQLANDFAKNIKNRMKLEPIQAVQKENGKIKIVECKSNNVIQSIIDDIIKTPLVGTTCVLANTNEEVLEIAGLLSGQDIAVKIIQSNDEFKLFDIAEIRYFYNNLGESAAVLDETWEEAKQKLNAKFKNTKGLKITENIITDFEQTNSQTKYKTDFEIFLSESKLEDFSGKHLSNTIFASTMHKAKGKEFDNVFIVLNDFYANTDERKRLLYVAMTRAKNLLHIHFHGINIFENAIKAQGIEFIKNDLSYKPTNARLMFLTHKDVFLSYFKNKQKEIDRLNGSEKLKRGDLFKVSEKFKKVIEEQKSKGYHLKEDDIKINFIVYWKGEDMAEEIKIVLPSVVFVTSNTYTS